MFRKTFAIVGLTALLSGCSIVRPASQDLAGLGAGILIGGITANPWIGVASGLAARIAAGTVVGLIEKDIVQTVRRTIQIEARDAELNTVVPWTATHELLPAPIRGRLEVIAEYGRSLTCREIIYTIDSDGYTDDKAREPEFAYPIDPIDAKRRAEEEERQAPRFFVARICRDGDRWIWADPRPDPRNFTDPF